MFVPSDDLIKQSLIFKLFLHCWRSFPYWFNALEVIGTVPQQQTRNLVFIALHSTHLMDVAVIMCTIYMHTGIILRVLIHRIFFYIFWIFSFCGVLPGYPEIAETLLKSQKPILVLPGGAEEYLYGHEHAYDLHPKWKTRNGFVRVARKTNSKIFPVFLKNCEEMRFNPVIYLWNRFGLYRMYDFLMEFKLIRPAVILIADALCFVVGFIQILVPVKLTLYIGDPVTCDFESESDEVIAERCHFELQKLIKKHQPHKHNYGPGLKERIKVHKEWIEGSMKKKKAISASVKDKSAKLS